MMSLCYSLLILYCSVLLSYLLPATLKFITIFRLLQPNFGKVKFFDFTD